MKWATQLAAWLMVGCCLGANAATIPVPAPPAVGAKAYILQDFLSGRVLASYNEDERVEPASITKLMTSYAVFKELSEGNLALDDEVTISEKAWRTGGSKMFVEVGNRVSVEELIQGMIVQSGNDACVALAEHIAGSEATFADLMNQYAAALGMTNTNYANSTGLPQGEQYTTAADSAILARALIREFPTYYRWYSDKEYTYNNIRQHNRNTLLWRDPSVDGLKTGYTEAAGYCLVSSAKKEGMRLVSVIMGSRTEKTRADESQSLLNYGFRFFETHKLYSAAQEIKRARVWKGDAENVGIGLDGDLFVTIPRGQYDQLDARINLPSVLLAPVVENTQMGQLQIMLGDDVLDTRSMHALEGVGEGSLWRRMTDGMKLWFNSFGSD